MGIVDLYSPTESDAGAKIRFRCNSRPLSFFPGCESMVQKVAKPIIGVIIVRLSRVDRDAESRFFLKRYYSKCFREQFTKFRLLPSCTLEVHVHAYLA